MSNLRLKFTVPDPFAGGGGDPFGGGGGGPDPFGNGGTGGSSDKCKPIQAPVNTQVNCISASDSSPFYHCIANADPGYQFRDGDRSKQKDCDSMTGNFFGGNQFEPVVPICDPPCQHRGTCVMPDTCACTPGWKGAKCEQAAALCADPSSPQGGSIQCHQGTTKKECTVTCQPGFTFEYQPSDKYTCSSNGTWTPAVTSIPNCLPIGSSVTIIPGGNSSKNHFKLLAFGTAFQLIVCAVENVIKLSNLIAFISCHNIPFLILK
ncbi:unnamed protein product [Mytilus coruscus]|uniref:Uncharacterized protein n=1 Tax=Mytilus coruscus TaxID=42192 RepID=A0A6J8C2N9_MYTCO|nr:unnamed protein product [Mytilus coruscus]